MSPTTVPIEANVHMMTTAPIMHLCPFVQEVDNGTITVSWQANGWTFELHSLREYLHTFKDREISHEDLTEEVWAELSGHYGIEALHVNSRWRTAGMEVSCSTSPTLVGQL